MADEETSSTLGDEREESAPSVHWLISLADMSMSANTASSNEP